jgi:multicomponent Na+:H+ antiporter subunit F
MMGSGLLENIAIIAFGILVAAIALAVTRLIIGPSLPDRIVALDLIASLSIGIILTLVVFSGESVYLDIAIFIALIVFIGTVAISKYLKRRYYDQ